MTDWSDTARERDYYREKLDRLGLELLEARRRVQEERRTCERLRVSSRLTHRLPEFLAVVTDENELRTSFLRALLETLAADRAILFRGAADGERLVALGSLGMGLPEPVSAKGAIPQFLCVHDLVEEDPLAAPLAAAIGLPHLIWAWHAGAGLGLLLGSRLAEGPMQPPFRPEDRVILDAALHLFCVLERHAVHIDNAGKVGQLFGDLEANPRRNIPAITEAAAELLGGVVSLYSRIDDRHESLTIWAGSNLPEDLPREDVPHGHICYEAAIRGQDETVALGDLEQTHYYETDPNVRKFGLKAYLGHPVHLRGKAIGALAVVWDQPRAFTPEQTALMRVLARAVSLEEERVATLDRLRRSNRLLEAIRRVNRLIVTETRRDRLLAEACRILTETRGFTLVWGALSSDGRTVTRFFSADGETGPGQLSVPMEVSNIPHCIPLALGRAGVNRVGNPGAECGACALKEQYGDNAALSVRLAHEGRLYGCLCVACPLEYAEDEEEHSLLLEVADDLGFALRGMEDRARQREQEHAIEAKLQTQQLLATISAGLLRYSPDAMDAAVTEALGRVVEAVGADRGYVFRIDAAEGAVMPTHEWCAPGVPRGRERLGTVAVEDMGWSMGRLQRLDFVRVPEVAALPEDARFERGVLTEHGVQAVLMAPMLYRGALAGFLSLDWVGRAMAVDEDGLHLVRLAGDILQSAISRTESEHAGQRQEQWMELALWGADLGSWEWDLRTGDVTFNERWAEMLGYRLEEVDESVRAWERLVHPDDRPGVMRALKAHLEGHTEFYETEHRLRHKDGHWIWVLDKGRVVERDAEGKAVRASGTHLDITERRESEVERKKLENSFYQAQKMESIGRLAGGVAHDFNNLLSVIMGYAELLPLEDDLSERMQGYVEQILQASERAQGLTQQLLMFSRKQVAQPRPLCMNHQIEHSLKLYRRLLGEDIEVAFHPGSDLPEIMADPQQFDQVMANLLVNARDAIHAGERDGGPKAIDIKTALVDLTDSQGELKGLAPGRHLCLSVSDTGIGMDEATRQKVFEPFFTTKSEGKGTGLGLSTVFGIVGQNHGAITVYSEPGKGSTFRVYWPATNARADAGKAATPAPLPQGRGETLLVVEDETAVRLMATEALAGLGYRVVTAVDGEEALDLVVRRGTKPDLLITDVVLPGMSGKQLADQVTGHHPDVPVLYTSGYTDDIIARHGFLSEGCNLLEKPYSIATLAKRVRRMVARVDRTRCARPGE